MVSIIAFILLRNAHLLLAYQLAEKLGLSITGIGKTVVVGGSQQSEKGRKGLGEGVKKLFK